LFSPISELAIERGGQMLPSRQRGQQCIAEQITLILPVQFFCNKISWLPTISECLGALAVQHQYLRRVIRVFGSQRICPTVKSVFRLVRKTKKVHRAVSFARTSAFAARSSARFTSLSFRFRSARRLREQFDCGGIADRRSDHDRRRPDGG
jgi:hypothetical protein